MHQPAVANQLLIEQQRKQQLRRLRGLEQRRHHVAEVAVLGLGGEWGALAQNVNLGVAPLADGFAVVGPDGQQAVAAVAVVVAAQDAVGGGHRENVMVERRGSVDLTPGPSPAERGA